jgi:hypothetical protein
MGDECFVEPQVSFLERIVFSPHAIGRLSGGRQGGPCGGLMRGAATAKVTFCTKSRWYYRLIDAAGCTPWHHVGPGFHAGLSFLRAPKQPKRSAATGDIGI